MVVVFVFMMNSKGILVVLVFLVLILHASLQAKQVIAQTGVPE